MGNFSLRNPNAFKNDFIYQEVKEGNHMVPSSSSSSLVESVLSASLWAWPGGKTVSESVLGDILDLKI